MKRILGLIAIAILAAACGEGTDERVLAEDDSPPRQSVGELDLTRSEVSLDDIIFDTFDGGSIPLSQASELEIASLYNAIEPIDDPTYETAPTWLSDDDLVLTMVDSTGQAWAWPHRILNFHELVADEIDGVPLLVTYCPLCRSGVIYDRRVDTENGPLVLTFGNTSALYENDLVMVDDQTTTYWWQVRGRGLVGTLSGVELTLLPAGTTTWQKWSEAHPESLVLTRESGGRLYDDDPFAAYSDVIDSGRFPFPVSEEAANDARLPSSTLVIVVTVDDTTYAVSTTGEARSVTVEDLTIRLDGAGGSDAIDADGSPYPSRSTFWFAAVSAFPDVELVAG